MDLMKNNSVHNIDGHKNSFFRASNVSKNPHNLERVIEKYKNLAKEALGLEIKFYMKIIFNILIIMQEFYQKLIKEIFLILHQNLRQIN